MSCRMPYCCRLWFFPLLLALLLPLPAGAVDKEYILAVVPQMPPVTMYANWTPFVERLEKETGLNIKLKVFEKMDEFEADFQAGTPDFLFASPTQTVLANETQKYIPLVRNTKKIKGVLFVKKESPITELSQLEGKNISFVGAKNL